MKRLDWEVLWRDRASFGFRDSYKVGLEGTKRSAAGWETVDLNSTLSQGETD